MSRDVGTTNRDTAEGFTAQPQNLEVVSARFWLSRLAEERTRRAASRWLALLALAGFALTLLVMVITGRGTGRWFFLLVVWMGLIFLPLWLLTQAFQSIGPALRRQLAAGVTQRADRYRHPASVTLLVEDLFTQHVLMPRITTPDQVLKAREAAAALVVRAGRGAPGGLTSPLLNILAAVKYWTEALSGRAASAGGNIQARWGEVRALAALAGLAKTLVAVMKDQSRLQPASFPEESAALHAYLDAVLDYCDQLALEVDAPAWIEPFPDVFAPLPGAGETLRGPWQRYIESPAPASSALEGFLTVTLHG